MELVRCENSAFHDSLIYNQPASLMYLFQIYSTE